MKKSWLVAAGVILLMIGSAFATLPKEWIEESIGFEPDGGSGLVELAIIAVPIVVGAAMLGKALVRPNSVAQDDLSAAGGQPG